MRNVGQIFVAFSEKLNFTKLSATMLVDVSVTVPFFTQETTKDIDLRFSV